MYHHRHKRSLHLVKNRTLWFDFTPKVLILRGLPKGTDSDYFDMLAAYGESTPYGFRRNTDSSWQLTKMTWNTSAATWYSEDSGSNEYNNKRYQMNEEGRTYIYVAIG